MNAPVRRVLMTADTVGGVWTHAVELAHGLASLGIATDLAVMGAPPGAAQRRQWQSVPGGTLHESRYRLEWMENAWPDVRRAGRWLLALECAVAPDLVHLNGYAHGAIGWQRPVVVAAHSCIYSWWQDVHGISPPQRYLRYHAAVCAGLRAARRVVAPSAAMLDALRRHYGDAVSGAVIHNGCAFGVRPTPRKESLVLAAGRLWDEAKNLSVLAAAAPMLRWPVFLAGEHRHPEGGEACFRGVHHLGCLPGAALHGWMARASIYALPARYEPFGLSVLEAASHGCALVLGDIASLRELWNGAADFVPPGDAEALARAVNALIDDPVRRQGMARAARLRAAGYTRERMAQAYSALYREACAESAAGLPA